MPDSRELNAQTGKACLKDQGIPVSLIKPGPFRVIVCACSLVKETINDMDGINIKEGDKGDR